jgi:hypothetical protein
MTNMTRRLPSTLISALLLLITVAVPPAAPVQAVLLTATSPLATATPAGDDPLPLVVLTEFNPWKMVLASDSPTFALYDNGQVIYLSEDANGNTEYVSVTLNDKELKALLDKLTIGSDFFALKPFYDLVLKTGQPSNRLVVWDRERSRKVVNVYGDLRDDPAARQAAPQSYLRVFDEVIRFQHPNARPWLPEKIEVIVWPYESSDATPWPKDWPDLEDPTTVKRETTSSIYLDADQLPAFRKLASEASAFLINGKTWAFSLRFPFPQESILLRSE